MLSDKQEIIDKLGRQLERMDKANARLKAENRELKSLIESRQEIWRRAEASIERLRKIKEEVLYFIGEA